MGRTTSDSADSAASFHMNMRSRFLPTVLSVAACTSLLAPLTYAEVYTWIPTAGGTTYNWNTPSNWTPSTLYPDAPGDVANVNIDILGNQTIRVREEVV